MNNLSRNHRLPPRAGFTLIEVLIAIVLILALLGAMYNFLFDILESRRRLIEEVQRDHSAAALIRQLEVDLMTCVAADGVHGSGIDGHETHLRILSRGVSANLATHGVDDALAFNDLQFTDYVFDDQAHRLQVQRGPAKGLLNVPISTAPMDTHLHRVRFRYHDGSHWHTSFESRERNGLPVAVEVSIWFHGKADEEPAADSTIENQANDDASITVATLLKQNVATETSGGLPPDRLRVFVVPDGSVEATPAKESTP